MGSTRRVFLKTALAAGAAGVGFPTIAASHPVKVGAVATPWRRPSSA